MRENENGRFRPFGGLAVATLVLVLGVLATAFLVPAAPAKDNPEDFTRIYRHTYDEVFEGAQEAIERKGWFVGDADKDKGTITVNGVYGRTKMTFEIHIEPVSPKPETRITINGVTKSSGVNRRDLALQFFTELQKVLVTYK